MKITSQPDSAKSKCPITIINDPKKASLPDNYLDYYTAKLKKNKYAVLPNANPDERSYIVYFDPNDYKTIPSLLEKARRTAASIYDELSGEMFEAAELICDPETAGLAAAFAEGFVLASYKFDKYLSEKEKSKLKEICISKGISEKEAEETQIICDSIFMARDMVNEPPCSLTTAEFTARIEHEIKGTIIQCEIFGNEKIAELGMGGIIAVNQGSSEPPAFAMLEYSPENAINDKPIAFVGKGIVYDTGGLSIKGTPDSMDFMKSDMSGGAVVFGAFLAAAKMNLPVKLIAAIPITDNRLSAESYSPGDVIIMHSGTSVEVLNTDAEGRLVLADALSYIKKYEPLTVISAATLTGAASSAIGGLGAVVMGNSKTNIDAMKTAGEQVYERLAEFPFWDEYAEMIKSDIADVKNIGGKEGGAVTAGKFLEKFTNYPYLHLDIAGPSFLKAKDSYRGKGATGFGVRLLYKFAKMQFED